MPGPAGANDGARLVAGQHDAVAEPLDDLDARDERLVLDLGAQRQHGLDGRVGAVGGRGYSLLDDATRALMGFVSAWENEVVV